MRFGEQHVFAYERGFFLKEDIRELWLPNDGSHDRFTLSGLADYQEALLITHEWYTSSFPRICVKEMSDPCDIPMDTLYNEPLKRHKSFSRMLSLPVKIEQEKVNFKRQAEGPIRKQGLKLWIGVMNLLELDYWPRIGDEFTYRKVLHEISLVHIDPQDYWQQSGWPLHVSVTTRQVQLGDWPLGDQSHDQLKDTGAGNIPREGVPSAPMSGQTPEKQAIEEEVQTGGDAGTFSPTPSAPFVNLPPPDDQYC